MAQNYLYKATYHGPRVVAPETVARELMTLDTGGKLTPSQVVKAAEPEDAALHGAFEWDDSVASHEYRLIQARRLIRAIVVVSDETKLPESIFVHVPDLETKEGKYVRLDLVTEDVGEYERALTEAQSFLDSAERRFNELRQLAEAKGGKAEALAIAIQGFATVRQAIALLR